MWILRAHHLPLVHKIFFLMIYRYPLRHRLRDGWTGKAGSSVSCRTPVSKISLANHHHNKLLWPCLFSRVARDTRFERLRCSHTGTYADDCLVQRVTAHKCYIVATCDRELRRRIRQIPGVPLMYIVKKRYAIERLPDQGAPSWSIVGQAFCVSTFLSCSTLIFLYFFNRLVGSLNISHCDANADKLGNFYNRYLYLYSFIALRIMDYCAFAVMQHQRPLIENLHGRN